MGFMLILPGPSFFFQKATYVRVARGRGRDYGSVAPCIIAIYFVGILSIVCSLLTNRLDTPLLGF